MRATAPTPVTPFKLSHVARYSLHEMEPVALVPLCYGAKVNLMYVCPCIIYEIDEKYPLDATIYLLL